MISRLKIDIAITRTTQAAGCPGPDKTDIEVTIYWPKDWVYIAKIKGIIVENEIDEMCRYIKKHCVRFIAEEPEGGT